MCSIYLFFSQIHWTAKENVANLYYNTAEKFYFHSLCLKQLTWLKYKDNDEMMSRLCFHFHSFQVHWDWCCVCVCAGVCNYCFIQFYNKDQKIQMKLKCCAAIKISKKIYQKIREKTVSGVYSHKISILISNYTEWTELQLHPMRRAFYPNIL